MNKNNENKGNKKSSDVEIDNVCYPGMTTPDDSGKHLNNGWIDESGHMSLPTLLSDQEFVYNGLNGSSWSKLSVSLVSYYLTLMTEHSQNFADLEDKFEDLKKDLKKYQSLSKQLRKKNNDILNSLWMCVKK